MGRVVRGVVWGPGPFVFYYAYMQGNVEPMFVPDGRVLVEAYVNLNISDMLRMKIATRFQDSKRRHRECSGFAPIMPPA